MKAANTMASHKHLIFPDMMNNPFRASLPQWNEIQIHP
jgi:hypothetical protein